MATDKYSMLYYAPSMLNREDIPWEVSVEGDSIVARWKWMNALWFAPNEINDEVRMYTFTVTLSDKGTYKELDTSEEKSRSIRAGDGKVGFGSSSNAFKGKQNSKSLNFGLGRDNETGAVGFVVAKYNTTQVKDQIRGYLEANGWKKAGMFG